MYVLLELCTWNNKAAFKNYEDMIEMIGRDTRKRLLVLSNAYSDVADETPRLRRKSATWDPEKQSGTIEGELSRFEEVLIVEFLR